MTDGGTHSTQQSIQPRLNLQCDIMFGLLNLTQFFDHEASTFILCIYMTLYLCGMMDLWYICSYSFAAINTDVNCIRVCGVLPQFGNH